MDQPTNSPKATQGSQNISTKETSQSSFLPISIRCDICSNQIKKREEHIQFECKHSFHLKCISENALQQINQSSFPVMCPIENCEQEPSMFLLSTLITHDQFRICLDFEVSLCPLIQENNCYNCGQRFLSDSEVDFHKCLKCKNVNCLKCHQQYHPGKLCLSLNIKCKIPSILPNDSSAQLNQLNISLNSSSIMREHTTPKDSPSNKSKLNGLSLKSSSFVSKGNELKPTPQKQKLIVQLQQKLTALPYTKNLSSSQSNPYKFGESITPRQNMQQGVYSFEKRRKSHEHSIQLSHLSQYSPLRTQSKTSKSSLMNESINSSFQSLISPQIKYTKKLGNNNNNSISSDREISNKVNSIKERSIKNSNSNSNNSLQMESITLPFQSSPLNNIKKPCNPKRTQIAMKMSPRSNGKKQQDLSSSFNFHNLKISNTIDFEGYDPKVDSCKQKQFHKHLPPFREFSQEKKDLLLLNSSKN